MTVYRIDLSLFVLEVGAHNALFKSLRMLGVTEHSLLGVSLAVVVVGTVVCRRSVVLASQTVGSGNTAVDDGQQFRLVLKDWPLTRPLSPTGSLYVSGFVWKGLHWGSLQVKE